MDGPCLHQFITAPVKNCLQLHRIKQVKWMNPRATTNEAYVPTYVEHLANVITHGIWVVPSLLGGLELVKRSSTWTQLVSAWVYGTSLLLVFAVSTFFHSVHYCNHTAIAGYKIWYDDITKLNWSDKQLKDVLHRCDRAMIYVFIAATYFPWLMVEDFPDNVWLSLMRYIVWVMATMGILYQQVFHERYKMLETIIYLVMGIGPSVAVITVNKFDNIAELKTGGLIYIAGLVFFKSDGRIPFAHAIWHLFVAGGAGLHYYAILRHLYPTIMDQGDPGSVAAGSPLSDLMGSHVEL